MTKAQESLYWREWGTLTKRCKAEGWVLPDRHELHTLACGPMPDGAHLSHKTFSNAQFDKVLAVFRSYSLPSSVNAQVRQERMPRTRLEHRIKIEQMRLLSVLADGHHGEEGRPAGAAGVELNFDAAFNYFAEVARIHGGPDLAFVSDEPEPRPNGEEKSDLELIRDTLDARLVKLRQARVAAAAGMTTREFAKLNQGEQKRLAVELGWTWHDVRLAAGVECDCRSICQKKRVAGRVPVLVNEKLTDSRE